MVPLAWPPVTSQVCAVSLARSLLLFCRLASTLRACGDDALHEIALRDKEQG